MFPSAFPNAGKSLSHSGPLFLSHRITIVPRIQLPSFRPSCPRAALDTLEWN